MSNREWYKRTFGHIKMPQELREKLKNTVPEMKNTKQVWLKRFAAAAAVLCIFALGEAAVFASTGETIGNQILIYINGKLIEGSADPSVTSKTWTDIFGRKHVVVKTDSGTIHSVGDEGEAPAKEEFYLWSPVSYCVEERQKKIYLLFGERNGNSGSFRNTVDNYQEIDITEDLSDGKANGIIKSKDGVVYLYTVTVMEDGSYQADIERKSSLEGAEN